jgi:hypothetical protein
MSYLPTREAVFFRGQRGEHHHVVFEKSHAVKQNLRDPMRLTQILRVDPVNLPVRGTNALEALRRPRRPGLLSASLGPPAR